MFPLKNIPSEEEEGRYGGVRPIFDLRGLNRFLLTKHFRLSSHSSITRLPVANRLGYKNRHFTGSPPCYIIIDISQAHLHVMVAQSYQPFLCQLLGRDPADGLSLY
jgi:hypothetical protein